MDEATTQEALRSVRICDFSGQLAGAGATKILAAFGAEVIRVEDPVRRGQWDVLRGAPPFPGERRGIEVGGAFNNHNVGKLGVTLNLRDERGRNIARRLIAASDVVTENFAAGVFERLGFGYDVLAGIRPDIIYVSNSGFGSDGPYAGFKSWGPIVQACCGLTFSSGLQGLPPAGWGYSYMDHHGANYMAIAVLTALLHRDRTGDGQWIDMSCVEAGATLLGPEILDVTVNGRPSRREGWPDSNHGHFPATVPHGVYPAAGTDSWIAIACRDDRDWEALAGAIGEPWAAEEGYRRLAGRRADESRLDRLVAAWTGREERFSLARRLQGVGVPAAAVALPEDRIDRDDNTRAWDLWPEVEHPEMGRVRVEGLPVHLSRTDWRINRPAPCLGQHNDLVFGELLGIEPEERAALAEEGVL